MASELLRDIGANIGRRKSELAHMTGPLSSGSNNHYEIDRCTPTMRVHAWQIPGRRYTATYGLVAECVVMDAARVELRIHFAEGEPERDATVLWLRGTNEPTSPQCIEMLKRVRDWTQGPSIQ